VGGGQRPRSPTRLRVWW